MEPNLAYPEKDEVLLQRILDGDREAFAGLVERYQGPLIGFLDRMIRDREAARDLAQDAFLKAFQSLESFMGRNQAAFSTWLFSIARNGCLDLVRSRKRKATENLEDHEHLPAPDTGDPARRLRIRTLMEDTLEDMNPDQRMAFELTVVDGFGYEEAAQIMRSSAGTIRSRVSRARELLQAKMRGLSEKG
jgi:RNA polymerase sigma-70 factor (ECF subfamily)